VNMNKAVTTGYYPVAWFISLLHVPALSVPLIKILGDNYPDTVG
jgi:hypothetical protein